MSVHEYLDKHMLSQKIEDAVNAAVRERSLDPVIFIANHMKKSVTPVITDVKARQIIDSRGFPTIEVDLFTNKGMFRASAPNGPHIATYEAVEFRDGEKRAYLGYNVSRAINIINERISKVLSGMDPTQQFHIDQVLLDLDKTERKSELGKNAMIAVSIAACKAGASEKEVPVYRYIGDIAGKTNLLLPVPAFTVITGGKHAGNNMAFQEIMILPIGARRFEEALRMGCETYHQLKLVIEEKYGGGECNVGGHGGFAPNITSVNEGIELVMEAIGRTSYSDKIKMAVDVGETESRSRSMFTCAAEDMTQIYTKLCSDYPVISIENPFDADDWAHTKQLLDLGICQVVGGNMFMSNPERVKRAIAEDCCNAAVLKVNEIATLTEAVRFVKLAVDSRWGVVVSGETDDSFLADLVVGLSTGHIKSGAPCRGEYLAKYNQLLRIEEELGDKAIYAGDDWRFPS